MNSKTSSKALDHIIEEMLDVTEKSKDEIFYISEELDEEYKQLTVELEDIKKKVAHYIEKGDELERKVKQSRKKLLVVSKNFDIYSEDDVRNVYEKTHQMQTDLAILRQEEKQLRNRRDDVERRLDSLEQNLERATNLANKISVIYTYLQDDFKQVNEMIADAKEKQRFGLKIIQAQEEERLRISREIHDGPAQMLANILLRSEIIDQAYRRGKIEESLDELKNIREMVSLSLKEVRRIIYDLRPMALDDLGLIPTIKKYIDTLQNYHQESKITFVSLGSNKRLMKDYEIGLFRLVQEALQNAIRHSKANLIEVKLEIHQTSVSLIVQDNGKGFNPEDVKVDSFGLTGMRERVELIEGSMEIMTEIGKGTKVYVKVPHVMFESN